MYQSPDEFAFDFRIMLDNIHTYYPKNSVVATKAIEIRIQFDELWRKAKIKMFGDGISEEI